MKKLILSFVFLLGSGLVHAGANFIPNVTVSTANYTNIGFMRNRIINGDMRFDQRNENTQKTYTSGSSAYHVDRWAASGESTDGVFNVQHLSSSPPTGFTNYVRARVTTADASIGSSQVYRPFFQYIEGGRLKDWGFGAAGAKTINLSFWVRSSTTGTFGGVFANGAVSRSYPFLYSIGTANTWIFISTAIKGDTTGTWTTANGVTGAYIAPVTLGIGSTFNGTSGAWSGSTLFGATGAQALISSVNTTVDLTGVQVEISSTPTNFEFIPDDMELRQCQRYFEKSYTAGTKPGASGGTPSEYQGVVIGASEVDSMIIMSTEKATAPTVTVYTDAGTSGQMKWYNVTGTGTARTTSSANISTKMFNIFQTVNNTDLTAYGHWTADCDF